MFEVKKNKIDDKSQQINKTINRIEWKFWNESTIFEMKTYLDRFNRLDMAKEIVNLKPKIEIIQSLKQREERPI